MNKFSDIEHKKRPTQLSRKFVDGVRTFSKTIIKKKEKIEKWQKEEQQYMSIWIQTLTMTATIATTQAEKSVYCQSLQPAKNQNLCNAKQRRSIGLAPS